MFIFCKLHVTFRLLMMSYNYWCLLLGKNRDSRSSSGQNLVKAEKVKILKYSSSGSTFDWVNKYNENHAQI